MGGHNLALRDIDLALASGYPVDKAFKLLERKAECHSSLGQKAKALESFHSAIKMIKKNAGLKHHQHSQKFIAAIEKKIEKEEIERESNLQQPVEAATEAAEAAASEDDLDGLIVDRR